MSGVKALVAQLSGCAPLRHVVVGGGVVCEHLPLLSGVEPSEHFVGGGFGGGLGGSPGGELPEPEEGVPGLPSSIIPLEEANSL